MLKTTINPMKPKPILKKTEDKTPRGEKKQVSFSPHGLEEVVMIPADNKGLRRKPRGGSEKLSGDWERYRYQRRLCARKIADPTSVSYVTRRPLNVCEDWVEMQNKLIKVFQDEWVADLSACYSVDEVFSLKSMLERTRKSRDLFSAWNYWTLLMWCEKIKEKRIQDLEYTTLSPSLSSQSETKETEQIKNTNLAKKEENVALEQQLLQVLDRLSKCKVDLIAMKKELSTSV